MDNNILQKYAEFAVRVGVNIQPNQTLLISSPIETAFFARMCAKIAYEADAKEVVNIYNDEEYNRIRMEYTKDEVLEDIKPWQLARYMDYYTEEGSVAILNISARDPNIYEGIDVKKVEKASQALSKAGLPWMKLMMSNKVQWSIVSIPTKSWAKKVFPDCEVDEAMEKLWDAIITASRAKSGDPVSEWEQHKKLIHSNRDKLNDLDLVSLHLTSSNGTDLIIGLADSHVFEGGSGVSTKGVEFFANIPTEEVFSAPHARNVNGIVKSSMPYVYNGSIIEGISVRFVDGLAVEYSAEKGNDLLEMMLSSDEGAKRLGEIALVPKSSPIRQAGILFYNTLFDENAACHIAFGEGYPDNIKGGVAMTQEEREAMGLNYSLIHEDIMIGTDDMNITGETKDGRTIEIFRDGTWAL